MYETAASWVHASATPIAVSHGCFERIVSRLGLVSLQVPWLLRVTACAAYVGLMTWLLLAPASVISTLYVAVRGLDKATHFCLFGLLVLFSRWSLHDPPKVAFPAALIPLAAIGYGAGVELMQGVLVKYERSFEWADIVANSLGAATFWLLSSALFRPGLDPRNS